jgi:hypothetical protein
LSEKRDTLINLHDKKFILIRNQKGQKKPTIYPNIVHHSEVCFTFYSPLTKQTVVSPLRVNLYTLIKGESPIHSPFENGEWNIESPFEG